MILSDCRTSLTCCYYTATIEEIFSCWPSEIIGNKTIFSYLERRRKKEINGDIKSSSPQFRVHRIATGNFQFFTVFRFFFKFWKNLFPELDARTFSSDKLSTSFWNISRWMNSVAGQHAEKLRDIKRNQSRPLIIIQMGHFPFDDSTRCVSFYAKRSPSFQFAFRPKPNKNHQRGESRPITLHLPETGHFIMIFTQ